MKNLFPLLIVIALLASCEKDDYTEIDDQLIKNYISANNLDATKGKNGIYYSIIKQGTGSYPNDSSTVVVRYTGQLLNGTIFDQTYGTSTDDLNLKDMIEGWRIAVPMLRKGGKGTFLIPSEQGYGGEEHEGIPLHSVLIYDIELVDIK